MSNPWCYIGIMNLNHISVTGPFIHENLGIFLLHGQDSFDGNRFISLDDALEQKCVIVHETGTVGQLEVENLSELLDLYIQAGDIVKGGRQDRTLGVDFVLPAKSGRVPIPSFCVESGRWHRRAGEEAGSFSSSKNYLASRSLRLATKLSKSQGEVWDKVAENQEHLSTSMKKSLHAAASPTSYQLSMEDADLQKRKETYRVTLAGILEEKPDAVGYVFVINDAVNTADVYGSGTLFRKLWAKLLDSAILEAIAESHRKAEGPEHHETGSSVLQWFKEAQEGEVCDRREIPPRVRIEIRRSKKSILFDTCDHGLEDAVLHRNLVAPQ